MVSEWSIPGSDGAVILGATDLPPAWVEPRGVIFIAHGFKGYKDYGMFPAIARACAQARAIAHRFNFSHSGMTNEIATFARPDLFERDTSNKQVFDLRAVIEWWNRGGGQVEGRNASSAKLPYFIFGHSRGGVTALLAAGRFADDVSFPQPAGVITAAAPASCNPFSRDEAGLLLKLRFLESPSSRTGQNLRIGRAFLQEQLDDPEAHDLPAQIARIRCPILVIHGENDQTVPAKCAAAIANAARKAKMVLIPLADHVFNTPNPMPAEVPASQQLAGMIGLIIDFMKDRNIGQIYRESSNSG